MELRQDVCLLGSKKSFTLKFERPSIVAYALWNRLKLDY